MAVHQALSTLQESFLQTSFQQLVTGLAVIPLLYILINELIRNNVRIPQLKGPRGLPLIGNLYQIRVNAAEQYRKWSKKYGGVYQIQLGNIPIVVVNTAEAAKVLFGQHAQALSSRPEFYTFHKVSFRLAFRLCSNFPLTYLRFYRIPLVPLSVLLHMVNRSSGVGKELHPLSTDLLCRLTSLIWISRRRTLSRNCWSMGRLVPLELTRCQ